MIIQIFFVISIASRQRQTTPPSLFVLFFLEDLQLHLKNRYNCGLSIHDICMIILLFAEDMVLLGNSVNDLQQSSNKLRKYCNTWELEVNVAKTKIVVFRKKGPIMRNEC